MCCWNCPDWGSEGTCREIRPCLAVPPQETIPRIGNTLVPYRALVWQESQQVWWHTEVSSSFEQKKASVWDDIFLTTFLQRHSSCGLMDLVLQCFSFQGYQSGGFRNDQESNSLLPMLSGYLSFAMILGLIDSSIYLECLFDLNLLHDIFMGIIKHEKRWLDIFFILFLEAWLDTFGISYTSQAAGWT